MYVPWMWFEPTTLPYWCDDLTNWATLLGWDVFFNIYSWILFANILLVTFANMLMRHISLNFPSLQCLCSVLALEKCWPQGMNWEVCPLLLFSEIGCRELGFFFLECLVELNREPIWSWCFMFWHVINYWFNLFNKYRSIQIIDFSFCEF